jgi:hypothetical protein
MKEFCVNPLVDPSILKAIGKNLVMLILRSPSEQVVDRIVEHCPNLQYLEIERVDQEVKDAFKMRSIKVGLMKLAKFKVNKEYIRLGGISIVREMKERLRESERVQ